MSSEEAAAWNHAVYEMVQHVPHGRVTSYAHIARLLDFPQRPRQVGTALKVLPAEASGLEMNYESVPWQRVVTSKGTITPRGVNGAQRQAERLRGEGVEVGRTALGEMTVDFSTYGWFPESVDE